MCSAYEEKEGESERDRERQKKKTEIEKKAERKGGGKRTGQQTWGRRQKSAGTVRALKFITAADTAEGHSFVPNRTAQLIIDGSHGVTKIRNR